MPHEDMALALGIARNTLEKHFALELTTVAYQRRMDVLNAQYRSAKKGNVAAQKAFLQNTPPLAVPPLPKGDQVPPAGPKKKEPALGKKEQADVDARGAAEGTTWGSLLPRPGDPIQ